MINEIRAWEVLRLAFRDCTSVNSNNETVVSFSYKNVNIGPYYGMCMPIRVLRDNKKIKLHTMETMLGKIHRVLKKTGEEWLFPCDEEGRLSRIKFCKNRIKQIKKYQRSKV